MSRKYLIVVDMQEDFVYGSLGSPEAREIVPAVVEMVNGFGLQKIHTRIIIWIRRKESFCPYHTVSI